MYSLPTRVCLGSQWDHHPINWTVKASFKCSSLWQHSYHIKRLLTSLKTSSKWFLDCIKGIFKKIKLERSMCQGPIQWLGLHLPCIDSHAVDLAKRDSLFISSAKAKNIKMARWILSLQTCRSCPCPVCVFKKWFRFGSAGSSLLHGLCLAGGKWGPPFAAVLSPLTVEASLTTEGGLSGAWASVAAVPGL